MQLENKTVVLTGAAGGMGTAIAAELTGRGARLLLTDLNEERLKGLVAKLGPEHTYVAADLCTQAGRDELLSACEALGQVDILINAAGLSDFVLLQNQAVEKIALLMTINLTVPMILCKSLLPLLMARPESAIVNIGSTFGSIGHPGFTTYCSSKFGLRGFTEALRRELSDSSVQVFYLAPRATRTDMNSAAVVELNRELGNTMDEPETVVHGLMKLLNSSRGGDRFLGWPEKLYVRLNSLLPRIVDKAMRDQLAVVRRFAQ